MRADAVRNTEQIRQAAITAFRERGLGVALEDVAAAAGVSKATVYKRFGGRAGLIDAVIEDLVARDVREIVARSLAIADPWDQLVTYLSAIFDLQYREPAAIDVLMRAYPDSTGVNDICHIGEETGHAIVRRGQEAGAIRADFAPEDLGYILFANGLALQHGPKPERTDYARRLGFILDAMRTSPMTT